MKIGLDKMRPTKQQKIRKIWVAMSTPFQANFFAPLIKKLENEYEFFVTALNHDNVSGILKAKRIECTSVGRHGGKELEGKLDAYAETIHEMLPLIKQHEPDLLLTGRWPEAVRVAFGFNIPAWTIFYNERERHVNQMVIPLCSKVFAPSFYSTNDLIKNGVTDQSKVVWFNGFHTCYLKNQTIDGDDPFKNLGINHPIVLVRPEPEYATFFPHHKPNLYEAVQLLSRNGDCNGGELNVLVMPRSPAQAERYSRISTVIDQSTVECPVNHADVVLGAAETMLMEAVVLGKPAVSSIYWPESKPVLELHKHIHHSTDPKVIFDLVQRCTDEDEQKHFSERMKLVTAVMDNPIEIIIDSIHQIDANYEPVEVKPLRRSQLEKLMDMVRATALGPVKQTQVMTTANVPHSEFKYLVQILENKRLIRSESTFSGKFYSATRYGLQILQDYQGIKTKLLEI